jgi:cytochrome c peroxidase
MTLQRAQRFLSSLALLAVAACGREATGPSTEQSVTAPVISANQRLDESRIVSVGRNVFFDKNLSIGRNQACASCHDPEFGFTSPDVQVNGHGGVVPGSLGRFAFRRPPSAAYAAQSPILAFNTEDEAWVGGLFWDGHATGEILGSTAADQALLPFVGPNEQALPDIACVVYRVSVAHYVETYRKAFGSQIKGISFPANTDSQCGTENVTIALSPSDRSLVTQEYHNIARAIAAFELSDEVSSFSSRFDDFQQGRGHFSAQELRGLDLYEGKAGCAACHPNAGPRPVLTDFTYDNIGVPANPENPRRLSEAFVDLGLGGFKGDAGLDGAQKVPTLRNLDKRPYAAAVKSYMHNGVFRSIAQVVHFYNTRDVLPACPAGVGPADARFGSTCWPAPEVAANVNHDELGNLGLTPAEEADLVVFLKTLNDRRP